MWTRVKDTLNHWKDKANQGNRKRRNLKEQVRYYQNQNAELRYEIGCLRQRSAPKKVPNHHYPAQMIALAVFIVVRGGSLRVAAAAAEFLAYLMGWDSYKCLETNCGYLSQQTDRMDAGCTALCSQNGYLLQYTPGTRRETSAIAVLFGYH